MRCCTRKCMAALDYIEFNDENSPNFMGEQISFAQFMEGDSETKEAVDIEQN